MSYLSVVPGLNGSSARCHDYPTTTTRRNRRGPTSSSTHRPSPDVSARDDSLPVTTRRATQPRRLSPPPSLFLVNYLSKVFLDLFPPPSDGLRQDRTIIRVVISDATSGPLLSMSSHLWPLHDDCSAVYRTWTDRVSFYHRRVFSRVTRSCCCLSVRLLALRLGTDLGS